MIGKQMLKPKTKRMMSTQETEEKELEKEDRVF